MSPRARGDHQLSYLFLNVNGAGVRHCSYTAGRDQKAHGECERHGITARRSSKELALGLLPYGDGMGKGGPADGH